MPIIGLYWAFHLFQNKRKTHIRNQKEVLAKRKNRSKPPLPNNLCITDSFIETLNQYKVEFPLKQKLFKNKNTWNLLKF